MDETQEKLDRIIELLEKIEHNMMPVNVVASGTQWADGAQEWSGLFEGVPFVEPYQKSSGGE